MNEVKHLTPQVRTRLPEVDSRDAVRFCPKCGREIPTDRQVCIFCENTGAIPRPKVSGKQKTLILSAITALMLLLLLGIFLHSRGTLRESPSFPTAAPTVTRGTSVPVILLDD